MSTCTVKIVVIDEETGEKIEKTSTIQKPTRPWQIIKSDPFGSILHLVLKQVESAHANRSSVGWSR